MALTCTRPHSCDLNNANLGGAKLGSASFSDCRLTGADLCHAEMLDAWFRDSLLACATLAGLSLRDMQLVGLDLSEAELTGCVFRDAVMDRVKLRDASLKDARFKGADRRGAELGGIGLVQAEVLKGATISHDQAGQVLRQFGLIVRKRARVAEERGLDLAVPMGQHRRQSVVRVKCANSGSRTVAWKRTLTSGGRNVDCRPVPDSWHVQFCRRRSLGQQNRDAPRARSVGRHDPARPPSD